MKQFIKKLIGRHHPQEPQLPHIAPTDQPREFANYIFICGLHRSGTTLLEQRLQAAFGVCSLEGPVPENEGQHLQDVYPAAREYGGPGRFGFAPEMVTAVPAPEDASRHRQRLLSCWTPFVKGDGDTLLEKSPPNLLKIPYLRAVFPGAKFIIMTRNPLAVAMATQKWTNATVEQMVHHWHVAHERAVKDSGPDCLRVRYEDFCEAPDAEIERIGTFCNLTPRPDAAPLDARFSAIKNSNAKYLDAAEPSNFGDGVWTDFGYDLD